MYFDKCCHEITMHVIIYLLLGEGNLIEEQTEIINKCEAPEPGAESGAVPVMIIGNNNVFEVLCIIFIRFLTR